VESVGSGHGLAIVTARAYDRGISAWILIIACAVGVNVMCAVAFDRAESAFRDWGAWSADRPRSRTSSSSAT